MVIGVIRVSSLACAARQSVTTYGTNKKLPKIQIGICSLINLRIALCLTVKNVLNLVKCSLINDRFVYPFNNPFGFVIILGHSYLTAIKHIAKHFKKRRLRNVRAESSSNFTRANQTLCYLLECLANGCGFSLVNLNVGIVL